MITHCQTNSKPIKNLDYEFFLPAIARLPIGLGERIALMRGLFYGLLQKDWRDVFFSKKNSIFQQTMQALMLISPQSSKTKVFFQTLKRFSIYSREEWEAALLEQDEKMKKIFKNSTIKGITPILKNQERGTGTVLITCHFESFCIGTALMGMAGLRLNGISSAVMEDKRVPRHITRHFDRKYRALETYMGGGKILHHEQYLSYFYKSLRAGDAVVILGDLPPAPNTRPLKVKFLGRTCTMAEGTWRIAHATSSEVAGFLCIKKGAASYELILTPPVRVQKDREDKGLGPVYRFFETQIEKKTAHWWAVDQYNFLTQGELKP